MIANYRKQLLAKQAHGACATGLSFMVALVKCLRLLVLPLLLGTLLGCPPGDGDGDGDLPPEEPAVKPLCKNVDLTGPFTATVENVRLNVDPAAPGIAVALVYPYQNIYRSVTAGSGLSDLSDPTFLIAEDTFQMGEITETFISAGLLVLRAEGDLELDQPLSDFLSEDIYGSLGDVGNVTLAQLARHESGLRGSYEEGLGEDITPQDKIDAFVPDDTSGQVGAFLLCHELCFVGVGDRNGGPAQLMAIFGRLAKHPCGARLHEQNGVPHQRKL